MCVLSLFPDPVFPPTDRPAAVIVGSLPAFKIFVTNRASAKRSRGSFSSGGRKMQQFSNNSTDVRSNRSKSVPLSPLSVAAADRKLAGGHDRYGDASDSQEEILRPDGNRHVMVKHDIVSAPLLAGQ